MNIKGLMRDAPNGTRETIFYFVLAGGLAFATSDHPRIADITFSIAAIQFVCYPVLRKTIKLPVEAYFALFVSLALVFWGSHSLDQMTPTSNQGASLSANVQTKAKVSMVDSNDNIFEGYENIDVGEKNSHRNRYSISPTDPLDPTALELFKAEILSHAGSATNIEEDLRWKRKQLEKRWNGMAREELVLRDYDTVAKRILGAADNKSELENILKTLVSEPVSPY